LNCNHQYNILKEYKQCSKCGHKIYKPEIFSRVVGYIRPISNWNDSKLAEFNDRVKFDSAFTTEKQTKLKV
jgi:ribonucleoside-triphosphate reductase (formate)